MLKKVFLILLSIMITFDAICQTRFVLGFNDGFKNGYCYTSNKTGYFCTPPLPPLAPLPQINESKDSYQDGYNRGFIYGQARRNKDDANASNSTPPATPPKFNPYIPQSPVLNMTSEERAMYYASKAKKDQEMANAIGSILEAIFTTTEEGRARRAERRAIKAEKKSNKKLEKQKEKDLTMPVNGKLILNGNANDDEYNKVPQGMGRISIWTDFKTTSTIKCYLNNEYVGNIVESTGKDIPTCGQNGILNIIVPPGKYEFHAIAENDKKTIKWNREIKLEMGECFIHKLDYSQRKTQ